jgi:hypothetical protein
VIQKYLENVIERLSVSLAIKTFKVIRYKVTNEEG